MGLETFTDIASLNVLWPLGSDSKSQGDDHLRGIKSVIKTDAVTKAELATTTKVTAEARNRVVNPCFQISQEWGNNAVGAGYPADQWQFAFSTTGAVNAQRVQVVTPNGSKNRLRISVTGADTSLAAGEYMIVRQAIEGIRVADFQYGTAAAKKAIVRFGFKGPAGTYAVALQNGAQNRSYLATFTITAPQANTDTEQVLIIPGDVTGTWLSDTGTGIFLVVGFAAGVTYQGAAGWQAGNVTGTSACSNGIGATGNFELFDIGCYLDPANSGLAPRWQMPDEAEEQQACMRYWWRPEMNLAFVAAAGAHYLGGTIIFPVRMRGVPTLTSAGDGTMTNVASAVFDSATVQQCRAIVTATAAGGCVATGRSGTASARL